MAGRSLLALLLVLPVAFWPGSTSYDAAKLAVWAVAGGLWALDLGRWLWVGRAGPVSRRQVVALVGLAAFLGLVGVAPAAARGPALRSVVLICLWTATVMMTRRMGAHPAWRLRLLGAMTASAGVACLYGLSQMAGLLPGASASSGMPVGIGTLGNQNYLAGLAAVIVWPSLALWRVKRWPWRVAAVTGTLILATTVVLGGATGPRVAAASAGLLALMAAVLLRANQPQLLPRAWGGMLLVGIFTVFYIVSHDLVAKKSAPDANFFSQSTKSVFDANNGDIRRADWIIALEMFRAHPVTGVGLGGYATGWIRQREQLAAAGRDAGIPGDIPPSSWAHNEYLHWAAETGLAGLVLGLVLTGRGLLAWRWRWIALTPGAARGEFVLLSCGLATPAVHALVSFPLHLPASTLGLAVLVGLLSVPLGSAAPATASRPRPWLGIPFLLLGLLLTVGAVREFAADLQLARGRLLYARGELQGAEASLTRGLDRALWPVEGHLYRGLARLALGRTEDAAADLARSLQLDPTYEALTALAELRVTQGDLAAADSLAAQVLRCRPYRQYRLQARFLQGLVRLRSGRQGEAALIFTDLLQDDPANHRAHLALGYLAALQGDVALARGHYRQALDLVDEAIAGEKSPGGVLMLRKHRQAVVKGLRSLE